MPESRLDRAEGPFLPAEERMLSRFEAAWEGSGPPNLADYCPGHGNRRLLRELILIDMERRAKAGLQPRVEAYFEQFPELKSNDDDILELVLAELRLRKMKLPDQGVDECLRRFPQLAERLHMIDHSKLRDRLSIDFVRSAETGDHEPFGQHAGAPAQPPQETAAIGRGAQDELPERIGRYRVRGVLGQGGFGIVYLADDEGLQRRVAVKVAHRSRISHPKDAETYLNEARTVAGLDHPNIVPVYDLGGSDDFPCFIVSKFIEGSTLERSIKDSPPTWPQTAELVAAVAEALHYAHRKGVVHRDIKPGNILLDDSGKPHIVDFGLALKEAGAGRNWKNAGTPLYMSPEQARGEGHRVDGRSDIFSLGVVFYQMLVGRCPFRGDTVADLLEQITTCEPRPPRQYDERIPKELERICFKAITKRAADRYSTARDMADDLRQFLAGAPEEAKPIVVVLSNRDAPAPSTATPVPLTPPVSDNKPIKIVPKGLRSFDAQDADFFLELLPGPRDRDGLPDSLRFWKGRIEEMDADNTFSVGLIYGPSGCGKSSLVKAGLLPRLSGDVLTVYVEAAAGAPHPALPPQSRGEGKGSGETEIRLINSLRKRCPGLPANLNLQETLAALRRGQGIPAGKKILIVLDQFEQWLHAKKQQENTELVQALRQCDGGRVQCVVMVRDDFWMAATRFMRELEVPLVEGRNSAAVDLFDTAHARKVLTAFGRAFGKVSEKPGEIGKDEKEFVSQAVASLAQEDKVVSVRLALFAEMMKSKPWSPASLKAAGGAEGVGATFLEETFSAAAAPPEHRYHQKAARAVLKALLPEAGADIKGHMRSYQDLLEASGYAVRPKEFADLIRILDSEIRLITPTDPEGVSPDDVGMSSERSAEGRNDSALRSEDSASRLTTRSFQLTHDYLVPSLRDWLTRKQRETRHGRAELLLAHRAADWNARKESRQLPSLLQWLSIRLLTRKKNWSPPQRTMMQRAARYLTLRGAILALACIVLTMTGLGIRNRIAERNNAAHATELVHQLLAADISEVPGIISKIEGYRGWANPLLVEENEKPETSSARKLRASLALLSVDPNQTEYLYGRLLDAAPNEVPVIRDTLTSHRDTLRGKLWTVVHAPEKGKEAQRLRAAAALAQYDKDSEKWATESPLIVNDLVQENPIYLGQWTEAFRPVKAWSIAPLADIFRDHRPERGAERTSATNLLADYAAEKSEVLADLLMDADEKQFAVIYRRFQEHAEPGLPLLAAELDRKLPSDATNTAKESLAKRKANAAATLFRLTQSAKVWDLLKHRIDPAGTDPTSAQLPSSIASAGWASTPARSSSRLENGNG